MLEYLRKNIEKNIADFTKKIKKEYGFDRVHPQLYEAISEYSLRQGKRVRPILLLLSFQGYASNKKLPASLYYTSICMEFLHNFMLVHDDIIDNSKLRRGKPTMHKLLENIIPEKNSSKTGKDLAIIAGDILYALAIDAFLSVKVDPYYKERALKYFIQTAALTAMGEFIDTIHGLDQIRNVKEEDVMLNYSLKTARYTFDCPLVIGAILAGASSRETRKLASFGLSIGQAFQIQDDIIGIFETEDNIGKSVLSDLEESKKTLLVCHAFNKLRGNKKNQFIQTFIKKRKNYKDLETIKKLFIEAGSLKYCLDEIRKRMIKSQKILISLSMRKEIKNTINTALMQFFNHVDQIAVKYGYKQIL